jgi:heat shock protein 5
MLYQIVFFLLIAHVSCTAKTEKDDRKEIYGTVIGIDLGTTYSCVGVYRNGRVEIIPNDQGNRITPSYVAFTNQNERLIGDAAKNQLTTNPTNTLYDIKRIIGRTWDDSAVQKDIKHFPFQVINENNKPMIVVKVGEEMKKFSPEEISAMILGKMREIAESYLGVNVTHAVVTVPAYFNDAQRQATKNAGVIAGLNVLRIINEPTAAAIAYGLDKKIVQKSKSDSAKEHQILVFDLGGGTFDVSLLTIDQGVFEVVATNGDTHLGGEDFDQRVIDYYVKLYKSKRGKDISSDARAVQKLRREVEKAKRSLSTSHSVRIEIESLINGEDFSETLSRAKFEELNIDLFKSTLTPVSKVLEDAHIQKSEVAEIVLVGGSTRIPKVQELVKEFFDGKMPNKGINPDEAIAYGAAVQAGILSGEESTGEILLLDVCPLTLGMEIEGGVMVKLIPRNTPIPIVKRDIFTTVQDNQDTVTTAVYEGERTMAADNHFLGQFDLTGIPPAPRGVPQIEVTFEIDVNGILKVSAEDKGTGNKQQIVIKNSENRLKPEEIDRMIKEAEKFKEQDQQVKERAESRGEFEQYVYSLKNKFNDKSSKILEKLSENEKTTANEAIKNALNWLDNNKDIQTHAKQEYQDLKKKLEDVIQPLMLKVYGQQQSGEEYLKTGPKTGSPPHSSSSGSKKEDL